MRMSSFLVIGLCVLLFSRDSSRTGDNGPEQSARELWIKPGTEWVVQVRRYSRGWMLMSSNQEVNEDAQKPRVGCEFHVGITVLEPKGEGDNRVARIQFRTFDDAPDYAQATFVLEIDANNGKPIALREIAGKVGGSHSIQQAGGERVLFSDAPGFPTAWTVSVADFAEIPATERERRINFEKSRHSLIKILRPAVTDNDRLRALQVEAALFYPFIEEAQVRIVQVWVPGESWWRSFTRYIQGHIDLEATLVDRKGK